MRNRSLSPGRTLQGRGVILVHGAHLKLGALVAKRLVNTCAPDKEIVLAGKPAAPAILGNDGNELRVIPLVADASVEDISQQLISLQVIMVVDCLYPYQNNSYKLLFAALEADVDYVDISNCPKAMNAYLQYRFTPHLNDTKARCLLNCGISPGVSNLIAASFLDDFEQKNDDTSVEFDFYYREIHSMEVPGFAQKATMMGGNEVTSLLTWSGKTVVDFSPDVGERVVCNFTQCEVPSIAHTFNVANVRSRMGFASEAIMLSTYVLSLFLLSVLDWLPGLLLVVTVLLCVSILFACILSGFLGCLRFCLRTHELNPQEFGMRIAVLGSDNVMRIHRQTHKDYFKSAANIAVLQIREVMDSEDIKCGVWFPEEAFVGEARTRIIERSMEIASFSDVHSYICTSDDEFNNHVKTDQLTLFARIVLYTLIIVFCTALLTRVCQWEVKWAFSFILGLIWLLQ